MNNNSFLMCLPTLTIKDVETNKYYIAVNININTENIYGDTVFFAVTDKLMPSYENDEIYKLLTAIKDANHSFQVLTILFQIHLQTICQYLIITCKMLFLYHKQT